MTRDECIVFIERSSWRSLDDIVAALRAQHDDAGRCRIAALGMAFLACRQAQPASLQCELETLLQGLATAKGTLDTAAGGAACVPVVTTRLLAVARSTVDDAAIGAVEWATTADVAEALMHEAERCTEGGVD